MQDSENRRETRRQQENPASVIRGISHAGESEAIRVCVCVLMCI